MPTTTDMPEAVGASRDVLASGALAVSLVFPRGIYSGAVLGVAEELPEHSRVHEAFVAAAAGGPAARAEGNLLVAADEHRRAIEWLEGNEPLGLITPPARMTHRSARRYRWRASPVAPADTDFEPFSALGGPVVYLWPPAPDDIVFALREIAREVTHVGRADSVVLVTVGHRDVTVGPGVHLRADGRGAGRVLRVARPGRFEALARAHAQASRLGRHGTGSMGKQAADALVTGSNDEALELRRFAPSRATVEWPFNEVWELALDGSATALAAVGQTSNRVAAAVGIHRALVQRIGDSVPPFVSGRDGEGPLRGAGHLAIHVSNGLRTGAPVAYLAIPEDTPDADREQLANALRTPLRAGVSVRRGDKRWFTLASPSQRAAAPFWPTPAPTLRTAVPMVLEVNGGPRRGRWTLDDAVVCSVGFAMRGVLERSGVTWGVGWGFRVELVRRLREEHGVDARTSRVRSETLRFVHRVRENELVVATHALVDLGTLAPASGTGFLAIGRARHLGGGLLVPARASS